MLRERLFARRSPEMCFRSVDVYVSCSSQVDEQLTAFFATHELSDPPFAVLAYVLLFV